MKFVDNIVVKWYFDYANSKPIKIRFFSIYANESVISAPKVALETV